MMSIKEIKALLDEGKIVVMYRDENGYAVTEFPPTNKSSQVNDDLNIHCSTSDSTGSKFMNIRTF